MKLSNGRHIDSPSCTYIETFEDNVHQYVFTGPCVVIESHTHSVSIIGEELFQMRQTGSLMALRSLSSEDREWVNTGISPKGWKQLFPDDQDGDEEVPERAYYKDLITKYLGE